MAQLEQQRGWGPCSRAALSSLPRWLWAGFCLLSLGMGTGWGGGWTWSGGVPCPDMALCTQLDCTAVHWACRGGHLDAVKLLQDRGADLNLKDKVCRAELGGAGLCQGHWHVPEDQRWPCVGLSGVGADPLWCPSPPPLKLLSTPLHVATRTGHPDIVEHLIHSGVDINSPDRVSAAAMQPVLGGGNTDAPALADPSGVSQNLERGTSRCTLIPALGCWQPHPELGWAPSPLSSWVGGCAGSWGAVLVTGRASLSPELDHDPQRGCVSRRKATRHCMMPHGSVATRSSKC